MKAPFIECPTLVRGILGNHGILPSKSQGEKKGDPFTGRLFFATLPLEVVG
jgi:hypothetical protein